MTDILTKLTAFAIGFIIGRMFERLVVYVYQKAN